MWVRPISMWTPDRFRKLNAAELGQLLGQDREPEPYRAPPIIRQLIPQLSLEINHEH